jgi:RHS repeat-associated protein
MLCPYKTNGQRLESGIGLYIYGARWYDPAAGRFIQADTIIPQQQGVQGWDRYAYVNNNPIRYTDPSGNNYCDSDNSIAEDCYGITEYLPDKACRINVDCYDAYLAYYQLVYTLGRKPSDQEILYMTAATEYWAYTDTEGVADIGQEALARNYFARCGRDGCQGSERYRFLAGYEVWTGHAKIIDGNSSTCATNLLSGWNGGKNTVLTSHIETIINMQNTNHPWTFGYDDNRPWQWFGPFKWDYSNIPKVGYSSEDDAILTVDLGNNDGFWMFTGIQDRNFHYDAWGS